MTKARVQQWNKPNAYVVVDTEATKGAILGVNLYDSTGRLLTIGDFAGTSGGSGPRTTDYLPEGRYRFYFTDARALAAVGAALTDSDTVTWEFDGSTIQAHADVPPGFVPTLIADGETFTVPENTQALFTLPIDIEGDGILAVDGALAEVS